MQKIVFSDVDGTLLNSRHELTPLTEQVIRTLKEQEIPFVIVSARSPSGINSILTEYDFQCPIVSYSGAVIMDTDGQILYHKGMPKAEAEKVISYIEDRHLPVTWNVFSYDQWITPDRSHPAVRLEESIVKTEAEEGTMESITGDEVHKIFCMCKPGTIWSVEEQLKKAFPQYSIAKSSDTLLEIMEAGVVKAEAVKILCDLWKVKVEDTVAFGDNYNDVEMLEAAGRGFLMANAPEELLKRIPEHTLSNDEDGIYHALKKIKYI